MSRVQFMHFRSTSQSKTRGGATVAIVPSTANTVLISVARCGPNDVFNKKIGRDVSFGRIKAYLNGRTTTEDYVSTLTVEEGADLKSVVAEELGPEMAYYGLE